MKLYISIFVLIITLYNSFAQEKKIKVIYNRSDLISSYKETLVADGKNAFYWNEEILTNNGVQRYKSIIILIKKNH